MEEREIEAAFWDDWNARVRAPSNLQAVSLDQMRDVLKFLRSCAIDDPEILEVGCGTGWLCDVLVGFGRVTGTDLSRRCLDEAQQRLPQAKFVAGDFMALEFQEEQFDVICSLEVLSAVVDQRAFIAKLARLLKTGGLLMLATQNKPMLQRWSKAGTVFEYPPLSPGQASRWLDQPDLRVMLAPTFDVLEMHTVTPMPYKMPLGLLTSRRVRALLGQPFTRWLEKRGWGWTIMVLAQKRPVPQART